MFQLVMSHIHDEVKAQRFDTDSCVGNIADGLVAIQAFQAYIAKLSESYGIEFTLGDIQPDDTSTVLRAWAPMPEDVHGTATIYVELQKPTPQDDIERIVELMRVKARFTTMIHPS